MYATQIYNLIRYLLKITMKKQNEKAENYLVHSPYPPPPPGRPFFNINVATNVAKTFLTLIDKHFHKDKKLSKTFNRNTIKVSYSCCIPYVKQTISNNNNRLLLLHKIANNVTVGKKKLLPTRRASTSLNALCIKQR